MNKCAGSRGNRRNIFDDALMLTNISHKRSFICASRKIQVPYVEPNQYTFKLERIADLYIPTQGGFQTGASMPDLRQR